jgi:HEPN domain-containing protein
MLNPNNGRTAGSAETLQDIFDLYFGPEIERRKSAGNLIEPFVLRMAQVVFTEDQEPEVRLNDEVRISLIVKAQRTVQKGDPVYDSDIEEIDSFELDHADADAGHYTAVRWKGGWRILFDFRRNKGRALNFLKRAEEFLSVAEHALSQQFYGPFVDNTFSACELLAKAILITAAGTESSRAKSHRVIHSGINKWSKLGNVNGKFIEVFNKLSDARSSARYKAADVSNHGDANVLATVRTELIGLKARVNRFSDDP